MTKKEGKQKFYWFGTLDALTKLLTKKINLLIDKDLNQQISTYLGTSKADPESMRETSLPALKDATAMALRAWAGNETAWRK